MMIKSLIPYILKKRIVLIILYIFHIHFFDNIINIYQKLYIIQHPLIY